MAKELYYIVHKLKINDTLVDSLSSYRVWYYQEIPNVQPEVFLDFNKFFESPKLWGWNHIHRSSFGKRKIKSLLDKKTFTEENFKKAELVGEFTKVSGRYSMKELMEHLSAEDFIEYCKDHNLTICPVNQTEDL